MIELMILASYYISRFVERMIDRLNSKSLEHLKVVSGAQNVHRAFYLWDLMLPMIILLAANIFPIDGLSPLAKSLCLGLCFLGFSIRVLAMMTLGSCFSLRCQWVEGLAPFNSGIYKYMRHPDSLGRMMEAIGVSSFFYYPLGPACVVITYPLFIKLVVSRDTRLIAKAGFRSGLQSAAS